MLFNLFLIVFLLLSGYLMIKSAQLERRVRARAAESNEDQPSRLQSYVSSAQTVLAEWRDQLLPTPPDEIDPTTFSAWAINTLDADVETLAWMQSLSAEQMATVTEFVDEFCESMGFSLAWLVNGSLAPDTELNQVLTDIVTRYMDVCSMTFDAREEITAFREGLEQQS